MPDTLCSSRTTSTGTDALPWTSDDSQLLPYQESIPMNAPVPSTHLRAAKIIEAWVAGTSPDAKRALVENPEFNADKSIVLDLAYAEYFLRQRAGGELDIEEFCA